MKTTSQLLATWDAHARTLLTHTPRPWRRNSAVVEAWLRCYALSWRVASHIGLENARALELMGQMESEMKCQGWM